MSISANFPNVRPSLLLDFANSQQLDPRVTFSRSTTAPYYDGKTSVLAEQNLALNSQDYTNAVWAGLTNGVTVVGDNATAPDGTTTADTATFTGSSYRYQFINTGVVTGVTYTFSVWVSSLTGKDTIGIRLAGASTGSDNNFSLVSLTTTPTRISVTRTFTSSDTQIIIGLDNRTAVVGGGQTTGDVIVWGFQIEKRSSVTAYNATTTSPITNYIPQLLTAPINAPRFDFNPVTGESLGLLIEQSSTNLLTYSQTIDTTNWTAYNAGNGTTTIDTISPDGTTSASTINDTSALGYYGVNKSLSISASTNYTFSCYVKQGTSTSGFSVWLIGNAGAIFQNTIAWTAGVPTATGWTATSVGNGYYRISYSFNSSTSTSFTVYLLGAIQNITATGSTIFWGVQLEALAFPTSYIPTTSAQVTRASDNASMTGANFSSWYNIAQGTVYCESSLFNTSSFSGIYSLDDGTTNNAINAFGGTLINANARINGSNIFTSTSSTLPTTTAFYKQAFSYNNGSYISVFSGGTPITQASGLVPPNLNRLQIGIYNNSFLNGRMKKFAFYPIQISASQSQALTGS